MIWKPTLTALALLMAAASWAIDKQPFTEEAFADLQEQNKLVLIDVHASWCPTCALQQQVLEDYVHEHGDVELHVLIVDFDQDRESVQRFRAPRQSTLLLYKGAEQVWFSVAETRKAVIFDAINRAADQP